jgi:ABC-type multidrug transport system permease subunit
MAALLGTNTAFALFHGIEQQSNYSALRQLGLIIVAIAIPFQAVYLMIYVYLLEFSDRLHGKQYRLIQKLVMICQLVSYTSIIGIAVMLYVTHWVIGLSFMLSGLLALLMVRLTINQLSEAEEA